MIITERTIKTFESETGLMLYFFTTSCSWPYDHNEIKRNSWSYNKFNYCEILGFNENNEYICVKFKTPKTKEITVSYLFDKCNKYLGQEQAYKNLSAIFKKLLPSYNFYETTYGVGMEALFLTHEQVLKRAEPLLKLLNKLAIEYNTEYSGASWVYRFKISKSKDNLEKINNYAKNLC